MSTNISDLDTLKVVRDKWKRFAPGTIHYIDDRVGGATVPREQLPSLCEGVAALDALIARMEHAPETPTALVANWMIENGYITGHGDTVAGLLNELVEQARMENEIDDATPKDALGFKIPKTMDDVIANDRIRKRNQARMEQNTSEPDITKCPKCGGDADNGHDRCLPPNPYYCTQCTQKQNTGGNVGIVGDASTRKDEENGHSPDASVCRLSPASSSVDIEEQNTEADR